MPTRFTHGIQAYPMIGASPEVPPGANVFFVDSVSGSNNAAGTEADTPLATIDYAIGLCTATNGDHIFVLPGHAETATTITMDVAGVTIWGYGYGRARPAVTGSGANDTITVTAANCRIHNIRLIGATSVTALLNVASTDLYVDDCVFEHGAAPTEAVTLATSGNRFYFDNCKFLGTANGPDSAFFFEVGSGTVTDWHVRNCMFNYVPNGLDRAVFVATADAAPGGIIQGCVVLGLDAEARLVDFLSSAGVGEGMIVDTIVQARVAATITDFYDLGGYGTARVSFSDGPNRGAIVHPTTSAT